MLSSSIAAALIPFQNFLPADVADGGGKKKKVQHESCELGIILGRS